MNYLKYIEHSAENLQFFLWLRDYIKRFNDLPESEQSLSPIWTPQAKEEAPAPQSARQKKVSPETAALFQGTDFEPGAKGVESEKGNPFHTPPPSSSGEVGRDSVSMYTTGDSTLYPGSVNHVKKAESAFVDAGLKWKPCMYRAHH